MAMLLLFETDKWFKEWTLAKPKLEDLLRCFSIDRRDPTHPTEPISVFHAISPLEEVEIVAAHFETYRGKKPVVQYGVRIEPEDCALAGVKVTHCPEEGTTGVKFVDRRHFNLVSGQDQFVHLIKITVARIWEGQDRLRSFPAHQICGQLAVFIALPDKVVEAEAKDRCRKTLSKHSDRCELPEGGKQIEINGELAAGSQSIPILAKRRVSFGSWWPRAVRHLVTKVIATS